MPRVSLAEMLLAGSKQSSAGGTPSPALRAFQGSLHDVLYLLAAVPVATALESSEIPPGLTSRFEAALASPTLGGLLQFLLWAAKERGPGRPTSLTDYLSAAEMGGQGFLGTLVQLRNRWTHPQGETPEEVLARAAAKLERPPSFFLEERLEVRHAAEVFWLEDNCEIALFPLVGAAGVQLALPRGLSAASGLILDAADPPRQERFRALWHEARVRDQELAQPTPEELREKAARLAMPWQGDTPWWIEETKLAGAPGMLVWPEALDGALASVTRAWREASPIALTLDDSIPLPVALAHKFGIAPIPTVIEWQSLLRPARPWVIAIDTTRLSSRGLLGLFFWIADLVERAPAPGLHLLIGRQAKALADDQERLWDRLPEGLSRLLRRPPRSAGVGLPGYLWPEQRPRKFGLFSGAFR